MEVILQENYPSLGYVGDRVMVKGGFARNFLIPRGIAVEASTRNERVLKHRMQHIMAKRIRMRGEAEALAKQLADVVLEFTLKTSESGKTFGSITSRDIETALKAKGFAIDRKQIRVTDALRKAGEFKASIKLHAEVNAPIGVKIVSEAPPASTVSDKEGKRARNKKKAAAEESTEGVEAAASEVVAEEAAPKKKGSRKKKAEAESGEE